LSEEERAKFRKDWLQALCATAQKVDIFQGTEHDVDLIVWSAIEVKDNRNTAGFFERYAKALAPYRHLLDQKDSLWGFTRPSQYSKARSKQEIDPFSNERKSYLVIYPFSKTTNGI
jgi:chlorite dismutase